MRKFIFLMSLCLLFVAGTAMGDWDVDDPYKWLQLPDLSDKGMDVDMYWDPLADDWQCTDTGWVTDIHMWGSFADDILPVAGVGSLTFQLTIYTDVPDPDPLDPANWSHPDEYNVVWREVFAPGLYTVRQVHDGPEDWYDPATEWWDDDNHNLAYQYNFLFPERPFWQDEGEIYWLEIQDLPRDGTRDYTFGWKTSLDHWNDDAVHWVEVDGVWYELRYPVGHEYVGETIDLAFVITPEPATIMLLGLGGLLLRRRKR